MFRISAAAETHLRNRKVYCGFSGGSDSLYLLLALKQLSAPFHFTLEAVHFEHGLRGAESKADAVWCREKCRKEEIPCTVISLDVNGNRREREGDEAAARRLRLEQWKAVSADSPGCIVALGHNADDRTENLFLRLFRGSNATGLTSMRFVSQVESVEFIRPLLELSKREIEAALRDAGEMWRVDSTNLGEHYKRNCLRLEILPALGERFPFALKGIRRSLAAVECDADFLERSAGEIYGKMCREGTFSPPAWSSLHRAVLCRVLRYFLRDRIGTDFVPDLSLIERFESAVAHPPRNGEHLKIELKEDSSHYLCVEKEGVSVRLRNDGFLPLIWNRSVQKTIVCGDFELDAEAVEQPVYGDPFTAFFSTDLPETLRLSVREPGERMVPFGKHSSVPLKKLFSDAKIKSYEKGRHPVLRLADGAVLWIPGVKRSALLPVENGSCIRIRARKLCQSR